VKTVSKGIKPFNYLATILGAAMLLIPAFYNGYPLVNSDAATFLHSGFKPETPFDRPITYGLLIRLFSIDGLSLWLVVIAQALLVSWLIIRLTKRITNRNNYLAISVLIISILSVCTSLSWIVSELIADVWTPIALLCLTLLVLGKEKKSTNVFLYIIYFISVAAHISHLILFGALLVIILLTCRYFIPVAHRRNVIYSSIIMLLLTAASIVTMGSAMSKSKHVFLMGAMLDKGILKKYLDDNCATKNYVLCQYKDELPRDPNVFIWEEISPLYKAGGWNETRTEYTEINHNILTTKKYLWPFIGKSVEFSLEQLATFHIGDGNTPFPQNSNVHTTIAQYVPHEADNFLNARQNKDILLDNLKLPNLIILCTVVLSMLVLIAGIILQKRLPKDIYLLVFIFITAIIINAADCATFSMVIGRYACKLMWMIPLLALLLIFSRREKKFN
jgi:hypothetical protein